MALVLERFAYTPHGTFGVLRFGVREWFTVERPWAGNRSGVSCIPEGNYTLSRYNSPTPGRGIVWQCNHVPARTYIQIHKGNRAKDVVGCIAIGRSLGVVSGEWAVLDSKTAFDELMEATADLDELSMCVVFNKWAK